MIKLPFRLGKFRKWNKGMGEAEYVFPDMPEGERCAWSCVWSTSRGLVEPKEWGEPAVMTYSQIQAELEDVAARTGWSQTDDANKAMKMLAEMAKPEPTLWLVQEFLRDARQRYKEYVCPYSLPNDVKVYILRNGWPVTFQDVLVQQELDKVKLAVT
jgi:hypothetical protein